MGELDRTMTNTEGTEVCDHCGQRIKPDRNGWYVGQDGTSDCPESNRGHEHHGIPRL